ncbi:unnamed protein product [Mytilus edulis]|uniref:Uncharacterized protein n=1 Tax=Mytilus edulis TaxID=6550 RepID=A0A8S3VAS0_MYTED|nr:unnamed protein product [Mytilus edulis]
MLEEINDLVKKRSTSRQEHILEENINVNEDSQCIVTYDQVRKTQTKHEEGENKDLKQLIHRNSYHKPFSQPELESLSNIIDHLTPNSVYFQGNMLSLELKDKHYRYWMTSHDNTETHIHDAGEDRERDSNKEGKVFKLLGEKKESRLTKRKEVKDQSTQTDDKQTSIYFDQVQKRSMHLTQTATNHCNTVNTEDENIYPGFLDQGTILAGKNVQKKIRKQRDVQEHTSTTICSEIV